MKLWVTASLISILGVVSVGFAMPTYVKDFESTYGIKKASTLGKTGCAICHVGKTKKLNSYGIDLQKAMVKEKAKAMTGSVLKKVEGLDSDKDGKTNLEELRGGTLPGDPKSK